MLNPVKVGILGLGTVGGGTVHVLQQNAEEIARRAGRGIVVTHACAKDLNKTHPYSTDDIVLTEQLTALVNNPEIEIIVELLGGTTIAREMTLQAIANGKHVVTANKALIAKHGNEIFAAAQDKGVMVAFEAAVGGGIPIIKAVREGLAANEIEMMAGIINGTCNFILTEMRDKGSAFADVLAEAQSLGYAEKDPTFDIEGVDAAHKLTILASIGFGIPLQFDKVYREGITNITPEDVQYANELGYKIKHLGITKRTKKGIELRVHPTFIPNKRLLANVEGVMNAVLVDSDALGASLYYGAGAGALPTASAIVADLVDVTRTLTTDPGNRVPHLAFQPNALVDLPIVPIDEIESSYYLRLSALDKLGVLAYMTNILSDNGISIEAIIQKEPIGGAEHVSVVMLTHQVVEKQLNRAIQAIESLEGIIGKVTRIRLEMLAS
ncbi:homoserine dehydrogenase [Candidatus Thiomargarita nelsonii]|uniref:Homoserine dehydrogenase n=1 Tax=Candidatus Thiomargarita nelsonii TaxID=1003181 RepID=A0A0A6PQ85_9GAMM|nr:homoserine dehydrogenase [Candidatus Thiomargarita nelsonii]